MLRNLLALSIILLMGSPAYAGSLAGVNMPDSVTIEGKNLVLNGMGLRKKAFIKVYVAGLYLPSKMKGSSAILSADTERRMVMHFVRSVGKQKICGGWDDGLENNTPGASADLKNKFNILCSYMADASDGSKFVFTYVPGKGTTVNVNGSNKGTISGKDFADALFKCWIGAKPPGEDFKAGLVAG